MERFKNKVAVITGGAKGIGSRIAQRFQSEGAIVEIIDKEAGPWYVGDIGKKEVLEEFASYIIKRHGKVNILVNNAPPLMKGINDCSWDEFLYSMKVGVAAPFYLSKLFQEYFPNGSSIVNISSSRDRMSEPQTESYSAAKGGISALTHSLAMTLAPKVRVNSISPGWIETLGIEASKEDNLQHPVGRIGQPDDIASMVLYLCSDEAGFITGENIAIDGGMTHQMIYHGDNGWYLKR
ncbi:MAG: SDR family oxidoreductase [Muribaculaceae bacterium]|nr:SDR family oxidoreductase [Muribaculaceae bacterium]